MNTIKSAIKNPRLAFLIILGIIFKSIISKNKNIKTGKNLKLRGVPIIDIDKKCTLYLGDNITLNSTNIGYHVNMHSPVKIVADRPGAIIKIGHNTRIHGSCIHAYNCIEIGDNCLIAANCQIIDSNGHERSFDDIENRINTEGKSNPIRIENSVWIGTGVIILPGVKIGEGSIISANSVVTSNIPRMVVAGGNPAKVLRSFN